MTSVNSSDVRKEWSSVLDTAIRSKPVFISRLRDRLMLCTVDTLKQITEGVKITADRYTEKDGSITLSARVLDIAVNGPDLGTAKRKLAESIEEYADEYYENYELYSRSPGRTHHIPYVIRVLISADIKETEGLIVCNPCDNRDSPG